jgi:CheY-like chemotaxis protein
MPFMNGWEFLKEFKNLKTNIDKDIIIYLLTSSNNQEDINKAKKIKDLSGYLVKPITRSELKKLIINFPKEHWYDESI